MANLKNGAIREMVIDRCLSDQKRKYSTKDILNACNKALEAEGYAIVTSMNTIRSDMRAIEQRWLAFGGEIKEEKVGRNKYYRYSTPGFSIYNAELSEEDLNKLNQTLLVLSRFKGLPQFEWIEELNARFKSSFMASPRTDEIINFDDNKCAEGRQFISVLFDAITEKSVLTIEYRRFTRNEDVVHIVHPYYLKEYNNRWFLLGLDEHHNVLTTFALDRIISVKHSGKEFIDNKEINFSEYFNDVIGVTVRTEEPVKSIKLWVSKEQYPYLRTKPLHRTQKVIEERQDGSVTVQIEVRENYELIQKLLSFGEKVIVVEPYDLRKKMQERIWLAGENYDRVK